MSTRSKAELLGLVERIVSMHSEQHITCKDIEETLRSEGYDISRESIRRTVKSNKSIASELMKTREETVALIDAIRDNPATDTNEATLDFLISKAFEYTKSIEDLNFKDLPELAAFISKMTRAKTQIVKQRLEYSQVFDRAKGELIAQLQRALEGDAELYKRMKILVESMEAPDA
ncbi:MAG: phage protein Gp27 family protein [Sphaerochaetaceae bacterium]